MERTSELGRQRKPFSIFTTSTFSWFMGAILFFMTVTVAIEDIDVGKASWSIVPLIVFCICYCLAGCLIRQCRKTGGVFVLSLSPVLVVSIIAFDMSDVLNVPGLILVVMALLSWKHLNVKGFL
mgnify:CR=1 FL=1